ncbi:MAG: hypothetical protein ACYC6Y_11550 [Thermoguttaceae bacterium]
MVCEGCGFAFELPIPGPPRPTVDESPVPQQDPLDCWLAGDPIHPRQVSDWQRLRQWSRQRPVMARVIASTGLVTLLVAVASTVMLLGSWLARQEAQRSLYLLQQQYARTQLRLDEAEKLVRAQQRETHRATGACQELLAKLRETEASLGQVNRRCEILDQGRQQIESAARLALVQSLAAESARRLGAQPAESLYLAERAMTYLGAEGEPVDKRLEQTLRDAAALTGDQVLRGHSGPVDAIAVSRNGRWLVTGSADTMVRLWDLFSSELTASRELPGHLAPVRLVRTSPDSRWAATTDDQGQVILWDLQASDPAGSKRALQGHAGKIYGLAISSDSRWLAVAGTGAFEEADNSVRLWDLKSLAWPPAAAGSSQDSVPADPVPGTATQPFVLRGHLGPVLAVAITPDCRWVVSASDDESVRLFDLTSHCPAASQVVLRQHAGPVTGVAVSPDGRWMVTASQDRTLRLWDLTTPHPGSRVTVLNGHEGGIHSVAISPSGRWVASAAYDQTVRVWNMNAVDPASRCVILRGHRGEVRSLLFTIDGCRLITGGDDGTACIWDLEAGDPTAVPVVLRGHCGPIGALAVTPDGRKILTGCCEAADRTDCLVRLWDLPIKEVLEKARPVIDRSLNAAEQKELLLETANRIGNQPPSGPHLQ